MAPRLKAVAFVCNSCRSSLTRAFSSTGLRSRSELDIHARQPPLTQCPAFPSFTPTSQPELDAIFAQYRETLFIPANLSQAHRRLVYRTSKQHILTNDPGVTVSISDEEDIKLRPMELTERPDKAKTLVQISRLLGQDDSPEAWSNLLPFLEGMTSAHEPVPPSFLERIARKANMIGTYRFVIECAEQARRTNVSLSDPFLTRELFQGCHERALDVSFKGDGFERAARQAQHIVLLMEKAEHCGRQSLRPGQVDMRRSLFVNSVVLEMAAARAFFASAKRSDDDGEVARSVARVIQLSQSTTSRLPDLTMPEFNSQKAKDPKRNDSYNKMGKAAQRLEGLLPLWSGLKFASKLDAAVISPNKDAFQDRLRGTEEEVKAAEADMKALAGQNQERRSLNMLNKLREIHA